VKIGYWFADVEIEDVALSWQKMSASTKDGVMIFGVLMVMTIVLIIWAAFIRSRRRRKRQYHYRRSRPEAVERRPDKPETGASQSGRRRFRRRRREHRPKNPTLAETGGLPPVRDDSGNIVE
jgi:hypothetical protein